MIEQVTGPGTTADTRPVRGRAFTLLEALFAIIALLFLLAVAIRFFTNMQRGWNHSINTATLYDNARIALDVICRDLEGAIAREDDMPGLDVRLHQPAPGELWLVTAGEGSASASVDVIEVGYALEHDELVRAFVDDSDSAWNIYGDRDDADDQEGYRRVIDGVFAQTFICYDDSLDVVVPEQSGELPAMVSVVLTLMDPKSKETWERLPLSERPTFEERATRTFRKSVRLGIQE